MDNAQNAPRQLKNEMRAIIDLVRLAQILLRRFEQLGDISDLQYAISIVPLALRLCPNGHPLHTTILTLVKGLLAQLTQVGDRVDIGASITQLLGALAPSPVGPSNRSISLNQMANDRFARFEQFGNRADLEASILHDEEALTLQPPGHPLRSTTLTNLSSGRFRRFVHFGDRADLDASILHGEEALNLCPAGHSNRAMPLNNLANGLFIRFTQVGDRADLDASIIHNEEALTLRPPGHPDRSMSLNNLGNGLMTRYTQVGDRADLFTAILYHKEALSLRPHGHPERSRSLNNLSSALYTRFSQANGDHVDLDDAIRHSQEALPLHPTGHPDRSATLNLLANVLSTRFSRTGTRADLDGSIRHYKEALTLRPIGHPDRAASLNDLANGLKTRFTQGGGLVDIDAAILHYEEALNLRTTGGPLRSLSLQNLADCLFLRHELVNRLAAFDSDLRHTSMPTTTKILSLFEEAALAESCPLDHRLKASRRWVDISIQYQHHTVLSAFTTALELRALSVLLSRTLMGQHQRIVAAGRFDSSQNLAYDATAFAIRQGSLDLAVEFSEQGRSTVFSQLGRFRTKVDDLRVINSELADRFTELSRQLDRTAVSDSTQLTEAQVPSRPFEGKVARFQRTAHEWNEVVAQIRQIEGFSTFLQRTPYETLQRAASNGPVVIINISKYRSDALIIRHTGPPLLVPLPDATPDSVTQLVTNLQEAFSLGDDPLRESQKREVIASILKDLWDRIVHPIVRVIDGSRPANRTSKTRIWWVPTSNLWRLPIHAAGVYKSGGDKLVDRFIPSYTPTLSLLIRSLESRNDTSPAQLLLVTVATQEGEDTEKQLKSIDDEVQKIHGLVGSESMTHLDSGNATRSAVLHSMQDHSWAHFACHAHQANEPFESHFETSGEPLRLTQIIDKNIPSAEFAFLAACHSAAGDPRTPDESIHLAAGMQFVGYRGVVGTMWAMADEDGPLVAEVFYKHMFRKKGRTNCRDAAEGLAKVTRALRRQDVPFERWINFVHYGI